MIHLLELVSCDGHPVTWTENPDPGNLRMLFSYAARHGYNPSHWRRVTVSRTLRGTSSNYTP